ncbi:MAG: hypothetical protein H6872_05090 [Methylobacteriaceae bacterium]|nr:hypothetical protein [Rhodoblastus sp.]MCC0004526.1 hypothetical protein [Methylobacteriaceae bacterium]
MEINLPANIVDIIAKRFIDMNIKQSMKSIVMPHWDKMLRQCRAQLEQLAITDPIQAGLIAVSSLLKIEAPEAVAWIDQHGNPVGDPVSGVILATLIGLNGPLILSSCLCDGRNDRVSLSKRLDLSVAILTMVVDAAIAFPDITSRTLN